MEYADYILWLNDQPHEPECEDQDENKECICLDIREARLDSMVDAQIDDLLLEGGEINAQY